MKALIIVAAVILPFFAVGVQAERISLPEDVAARREKDTVQQSSSSSNETRYICTPGDNAEACMLADIGAGQTTLVDPQKALDKSFAKIPADHMKLTDEEREQMRKSYGVAQVVDGPNKQESTSNWERLLAVHEYMTKKILVDPLYKDVRDTCKNQE